MVNNAACVTKRRWHNINGDSWSQAQERRSGATGRGLRVSMPGAARAASIPVGISRQFSQIPSLLACEHNVNITHLSSLGTSGASRCDCWHHTPWIHAAIRTTDYRVRGDSATVTISSQIHCSVEASEFLIRLWLSTPGYGVLEGEATTMVQFNKIHVPTIDSRKYFCSNQDFIQ